MNSGLLVSELHVLQVNNTNVITMSFPPLANRTLLEDIKEANEQFYSGVVIGVLSSALTLLFALVLFYCCKNSSARMRSRRGRRIPQRRPADSDPESATTSLASSTCALNKSDAAEDEDDPPPAYVDIVSCNRKESPPAYSPSSHGPSSAGQRAAPAEP